MLIDEAEIIVRGGHGGPGKVSFYPGEHAGPDGGNGGRGGDLYLHVVSDLTALRPFTVKKVVAADNGLPGDGNRKFGSDGADREIRVPVGCLITDQKTGETWELEEPNVKILIAKGGLGGKGNFEFKSSTRTTPKFAQPGLPGQERDLKISLRFIAEIGLIGLPNAGKSSLINELTAAKATIANYPFTTLEPNLGSMHGVIIADLPGLIEGASNGRGLGIKFLKHVEKVKLLVHCIDATSEDVLADYQTIKKELEQFNKELLDKKEIIVLTKSDLVEEKELKQKQKDLKKLKKDIIVVSIHNFDQIEDLKKALKNL